MVFGRCKGVNLADWVTTLFLLHASALLDGYLRIALHVFVLVY